MTETWRPVVGLEDQYEVSNYGRVRNIKRGGRLLKPYAQANSGHLSYRSLGGRGKSLRLAHRLVYEAFVGPIPEGLVVRHLDGNPVNNSPQNLCLGTQRDNIHDIYSYGKKCGPGKFHADEVAEIRAKLSAGARNIDLAKEYGVSPQTIYNIKHRKTFDYL